MTVAVGATDVHLGWNVVTDARHLLAYPFMVNALRAGTVVAVVASVTGWFVVLRRQTFAAHTLSLIGFPGAAGAVWLGLGAQAGFFAFCVAGAVAIGVLPNEDDGRRSEESAVVGTVQALALASGFLFVTLYRGNLGGVGGLLFGNFLGITSGQVLVLVLVAGPVVALTLGAARPLLFASVDPAVAAARGVPVRLLGVVFLVLVGVAVAACSQITGSLLVFALLVLPPATAQRLTPSPLLGLGLGVALALGVTWLGLGIAFYSPYPIGFWISSLAFAAYAASVVATKPAHR